MLLILNACFFGVCIVSWIMIFPGPEPINIQEAVKTIENPNLDVIEEEIDEENFSISQVSFEDSIEAEENLGLERPLIDGSSTLQAEKGTKDSSNPDVTNSIIPSPEVASNHETDDVGVEVEFVDIDNIAKPGKKEIDLDNVILTNGQKNDMVKQMLASK